MRANRRAQAWGEHRSRPACRLLHRAIDDRYRIIPVRGVGCRARVLLMPLAAICALAACRSGDTAGPRGADESWLRAMVAGSSGVAAAADTIRFEGQGCFDLGTTQTLAFGRSSSSPQAVKVRAWDIPSCWRAMELDGPPWATTRSALRTGTKTRVRFAQLGSTLRTGARNLLQATPPRHSSPVRGSSSSSSRAWTGSLALFASRAPSTLHGCRLATEARADRARCCQTRPQFKSQAPLSPYPIRDDIAVISY